jgi:uncharacterized membrane protein YidH (DUF202 family)
MTGEDSLGWRMGKFVIINLASYFIGFAIASIGGLVRNLFLLRAGLILIALGAAAGGAVRLQAWASLDKRPPIYGLISIGLRIVAGIVILLIAIRVHFWDSPHLRQAPDRYGS